VVERRVITVEGIVQGVGFRPHVHRLATSFGLCGSVRNGHEGLVIDVQGDTAALDGFALALTEDAPPLASIARVHCASARPEPASSFTIAESTPTPGDGRDAGPSPGRATFPPPDSTICEECLAELFDPGNRRFRYPFLNCTNCGPRFTIVRELPYDRARTTMAGFAMCTACHAEYVTPADRRFHAQPTACADCGPAARLVWPRPGMTVQSSPHAEPIVEAARALAAGHIVAIKGLGGYHIACDATNRLAVERLRARKHRQDKPLAVMVPDIETAERICEITPEERTLLESRERPIVLLEKRGDLDREARNALEAIAPRNRHIGVMLPYTPLHHLLLAATGIPLVMTSGNLTDEPIAFEDGDALERLSPLVDLFLTHDRPIATRCDDSVMRVVNREPEFIRRSRGFVPRPIIVAVPFASHVLAVGGQLKNTFCLARDHLAFLSPHVGDLSTPAACRSLDRTVAHLAALVGVQPRVIAHDLHPDYASTALASRGDACDLVAVQHHHAHVASCMAEHQLSDPVIGVVFDGAGLGDDGAVWGGEFLVVDRNGYRRVGHLGYVPLPGGDAAVRRPLRMALAHLWNAYGPAMTALPLALLARARDGEVDLVLQMLARGVSAPPTSSIGRLFDAVSSLVGLRDDTTFEGQAAVDLEGAAGLDSSGSYTFTVAEHEGMSVVDPAPVIRGVVDGLAAGRGASAIAAAFHNSLARMILDVARDTRSRTGINRVVLSGGVFQNALLATRTTDALERAGFRVFTHRLVPCNDGGLALGQAYVVALRGLCDELEGRGAIPMPHAASGV